MPTYRYIGEWSKTFPDLKFNQGATSDGPAYNDGDSITLVAGQLVTTDKPYSHEDLVEYTTEDAAADAADAAAVILSEAVTAVQE
jgi:hypothetical protein